MVWQAAWHPRYIIPMLALVSRHHMSSSLRCHRSHWTRILITRGHTSYHNIHMLAPAIHCHYRGCEMGEKYRNLKMMLDWRVKSASEEVSDDWMVWECHHINIWSLVSWYCRPGLRTIVSFPRPGPTSGDIKQKVNTDWERRGCWEEVRNILLIHRDYICTSQKETKYKTRPDGR